MRCTVEQAVELYEDVVRRRDGLENGEAAAAAIDHFTASRGNYLPGFGHWSIRSTPAPHPYWRWWMAQVLREVSAATMPRPPARSSA